MADIPSTARVVIIGGGAVGASSLYHLAKAGWTDCVLLEKNELTAGSTWHAAGNVPTFSTSWAIMNMQRYSTELYARLGDEVDYPMNYHVTGSIRLAHSDERMDEFRRVVGMGRYQGMDLKLLTPDEAMDWDAVEEKGLAGSVMDYPAVNFAPTREQQTRFYAVTPGAYDDWFIEYGYSPALADPAAEAAVAEAEARDRLPGPADAQLVDELARTLAVEVHLPVTGD